MTHYNSKENAYVALWVLALLTWLIDVKTRGIRRWIAHHRFFPMVTRLFRLGHTRGHMSSENINDTHNRYFYGKFVKYWKRLVQLTLIRKDLMNNSWNLIYNVIRVIWGLSRSPNLSTDNEQLRRNPVPCRNFSRFFFSFFSSRHFDLYASRPINGNKVDLVTWFWLNYYIILSM